MKIHTMTLQTILLLLVHIASSSRTIWKLLPALAGRTFDGPIAVNAAALSLQECVIFCHQDAKSISLTYETKMCFCYSKIINEGTKSKRQSPGTVTMTRAFVINKYTSGSGVTFKEARQATYNGNQTPCAGIQTLGFVEDGVYQVNLTSQNLVVDVLCETDDGGWTVIQKRGQNNISFARNFNEYVHGFGDLHSDFWLGLQNIQAITSEVTDLKIEVVDDKGTRYIIRYSSFNVGDPSLSYALNVSGFIQGPCGDPLILCNKKSFQTLDKCPGAFIGCSNSGWWFADVPGINLNAPLDISDLTGACLPCGGHWTSLTKTKLSIK